MTWAKPLTAQPSLCSSNKFEPTLQHNMTYFLKGKNKKIKNNKGNQYIYNFWKDIHRHSVVSGILVVGYCCAYVKQSQNLSSATHNPKWYNSILILALVLSIINYNYYYLSITNHVPSLSPSFLKALQNYKNLVNTCNMVNTVMDICQVLNKC